MNAHEIALRMADRAQAICEHLLPQGKKRGNEWKAGNIHGDAGDSLSVRLTGEKRGVWKDFSTGEGGDLLDLWAASRGLTMAQALPDVHAYLGIRSDVPEREPKSYKLPKKPACSKPANRVLEWLHSRGFTDASIAAFRIGARHENDRDVVVFPYLRDGVLVNAKYRDIDDKKLMRQEGGAEPCLFGWHLIDPNARRVAISEGECDAIALHQVGIQALSVNAGAGNHQWIENDWERLERFSEILICFDNDEPGQKGAREVAKRLGIERCKIVTFIHKDANDALLAGMTPAEFEECCEEGKYLSPDELVRAGKFTDQVLSLFFPAKEAPQTPCLVFGGREFPWLQFRGGETTVWTGISGHGKSLMLGQVLLGFRRFGDGICIYSGEMPAARTLHRMARQAGAAANPTIGLVRAAMDWLNAGIWVFDVRGTASLDRLLEVFAYASRRYGIKQHVIDSLMMLADVPEDGPGALTAQKEAMRKIVAFSESHDVHVHLVAHPRKGKNESDAPGKMDVAGSSKITDAASNVVTVWSARKEPDDPDDGKPDAKLELQKQRNGDEQHRTLWLYYERNSQQFVPDSRRYAVPYFEYGAEKLREFVDEQID